MKLDLKPTKTPDSFPRVFFNRQTRSDDVVEYAVCSYNSHTNEAGKTIKTDVRRIGVIHGADGLGKIEFNARFLRYHPEFKGLEVRRMRASKGGKMDVVCFELPPPQLEVSGGGLCLSSELESGGVFSNSEQDTKLESPVFTSSYRVYYEDTDAGGIVYHANYLKFCERARTDFLRDGLGIKQSTMLQESKKGFVITSIEAKFISSAHLDELLTVSCEPLQVKRASLKIYQEIKNEEGKVLFAMSSTLGFVDLARGRPEAIPEDVRDFFQRYVVSSEKEKRRV